MRIIFSISKSMVMGNEILSENYKSKTDTTKINGLILFTPQVGYG